MLKSIDYINGLERRSRATNEWSDILKEIQIHCSSDYGRTDRKIAKFLLCVKFPEYKDEYRENSNSMAYDVFHMAEIIKRILDQGYEDFLKL